ncbi:NAD(P)-binding domain-containing protein [Saccharothrix sp. S26]|uniref:NAD(P)-dependent oxidoreductase n=1 Tax=Saccharothrix sp. S26 TaxID=2907215 RepID=UPI001F21383A|nr:NAD(P)-binding domain-containing protein [Saccharothrix sp. S26]MCE6999013.1 NAD(P)-binding domain-containing protein [Saccharothrix sp. S26]
MSNPNAAQAPVTVIGLGLMGQALAAAFLGNGHPTTVWNRSAHKADELVGKGAVLAPSVKDAIEASPLVVICVSDYDSVHELLDPVEGSLAGRTLVNMTSASSSQARGMAKWAEGKVGAYIDSAIMAIPPGIATDEAIMLYCGPKSAFDQHAETLKVLAPAGTTYLGEDHGLASLHDVSLLTMMWGVENSFLHGVALLGTAGVKATEYLPLAKALAVMTLGFIEAYAEQIDSGDWPAEDSTIDTHVDAMDHLLDESRELGVNTEWPALITALGKRAIAEGHGPASYAAMVEVFRKPSA